MRAGERANRYTFSKEVSTIGRAKGNDIVIFDTSVADTHSCIQLRAGSWSVTPLRGAVHVDDVLVRPSAPPSWLPAAGRAGAYLDASTSLETSLTTSVVRTRGAFSGSTGLHVDSTTTATARHSALAATWRSF